MAFDKPAATCGHGMAYDQLADDYFAEHCVSWLSNQVFLSEVSIYPFDPLPIGVNNCAINWNG